MKTEASSDHVAATDIQGNLVGFNKDHVRLLFVGFPSEAAGQAFLAALAAAEIANARDVLEANHFVKQVESGEHEDRDSLNFCWTNVALSFAGLQTLGAASLDAFPDEFKAGMAARASTVGDVDDSAPATWVSAFAPGLPPVHALVITAADQPATLDERTTTIENLIQTSGVTLLGQQDGNARPGDASGHEHFGFKDGISQPGINGLTQSSKGGDPIAAGEFLIGYPDQDGNVSGTPTTPTNPTPTQGGYTPVPPPPLPQPLPDWTHNGSFVVYRRLRQNVQAFQQFLQAQAATAGLDPNQLGAKLVGRWPSGAPLEHVPGQAAHADNAAVDPSIADPSVLHDQRINNFDYQKKDSDGHAVPRAAHIRKVYPRDETPPGDNESERHRIIRRGIPYGPELQQNEEPYPGSGNVPDDTDRGLLFLCYQSSIARGFEFVQSQWVNQPNFPQDNDGNDPIISQDLAAPSFTLPPNNPHLALARWVTTTGGDYFFSPSLSALETLAGK